MSEENQFDKQFDNDPERTLITLEQLSQTIEVMTSVVNRLRKHLSEQLKAQIETQRQERLEKEKTALESEQNQESDSIGNKRNVSSDQHKKIRTVSLLKSDSRRMIQHARIQKFCTSTTTLRISTYLSMSLSFQWQRHFFLPKIIALIIDGYVTGNHD